MWSLGASIFRHRCLQYTEHPPADQLHASPLGVLSGSCTKWDTVPLGKYATIAQRVVPLLCPKEFAGPAVGFFSLDH